MAKKIKDFGEKIPMARKDGEIRLSGSAVKWQGLENGKVLELAKTFKTDFADESGEYLSPYQTALFLKIAAEKLVKYYITDYLDAQSLKEQEELVSQSITEIGQEMLSAIYAARGIPEPEMLKELANRLTEILYRCTDRLQSYIPQLDFYLNVILNLAKADAWARLDDSGVFGTNNKEAIIEKNIRVHRDGFYEIHNGILATIPTKQDFRYANRRRYWRRSLSLSTQTEKVAYDDDYKGGLQFIVINSFEKKAYTFDTEEEAIKAVHSLRKVASVWMLDYKKSAEDAKEKKRSQKPRWHPREKDLERKMPVAWLDGHNTTPKDYLNILGVYGCQFGNYVSQDLRQKQMNLAFEAFVDLAQILDIRTTDVFFKNAENARLAISFGARGRGGASGGIAHFEPLYEVMNFTKQRGYGCLAHEWGHSFDNFLYKLIKGTTANDISQRTPFLIGLTPDCFIREELKAIESVFNKRRGAYRSVSAKFAVIYRGGAKYWMSRWEMFARAFEAYVLDKMAEKGYLSDALVFEHDDYPYPPKGEERETINSAIDGIFSKLKERGIFQPFDEEIVTPEETKRKKILIGTDDYAANLQVGDGGQISFVAMG